MALWGPGCRPRLGTSWEMDAEGLGGMVGGWRRGKAGFSLSLGTRSSHSARPTRIRGMAKPLRSLGRHSQRVTMAAVSSVTSWHAISTTPGIQLHLWWSSPAALARSWHYSNLEGVRGVQDAR